MNDMPLFHSGFYFLSPSPEGHDNLDSLDNEIDLRSTHAATELLRFETLTFSNAFFPPRSITNCR